MAGVTVMAATDYANNKSNRKQQKQNDGWRHREREQTHSDEQ